MALGLLFNHASLGNTASITETQAKLQKLDTKIIALKHTLSHAEDKHGTLNQALRETEKKISTGVQKLYETQQAMTKKEHEMAALQQRVTTLNEELQTQQQLLIDHLRARYAMGENQPIKWLLNQNDPYTSDRLLTFYQYIIQSRQHLIDQVSDTKQKLAKSQNALHQSMIEQQQLHQQLSLRQQKLKENKQDQTAILQTLAKDIRTNQQTLNDYQRNKDNLSQLLTSLTQQTRQPRQSPFTYLRRKLPRPVNVNDAHIQHLNQGILFSTNEGEPVNAVSSGKIVFSDWLKGYGLLLIIDHGQGFMTLYAHNQSLFKQKGDSVNQGEQIATTGHSGGLKQNGLYFEVRQRGKAIPPLQWLS